MRTVVTALRLLEELAERQPVGVSEFARAVNMPKATVHRFLRALEDAGWIRATQEELPRWVLTARPLMVAQWVASDLGVREASLAVMEELREATGESVHLAVPEAGEIVIIERVVTTQPVRIHWPVGHSPSHATANGKALLAFATDEQKKAWLPTEMRAFTDETITTEAELEADLVIVRERGWAIAHGELRNDIGSVAAPILGPGNQPVASLSVVFPLHRMPVDGCVKWGHLVSDAAAKVAGNLWGNQSQHRTGSRS